MGVLNVTPDSFYDGGRYIDADRAEERAEQMIAEGADIIDVGGESTQPGADPVPADEEMPPGPSGHLSGWLAVGRRTHLDRHVQGRCGESRAGGGRSIVNDITGCGATPIWPKSRRITTPRSS